ncbi:hypothetical protein B484DRAFT_155438 [Ochromonadaceae sp. CCMP2298]|nr:hypothetical protein B484DRAFT_155438 [Ochromonadaceae sp. CCMP2298]|mmetsp:Transcript_32097/g.71333  ORF Transcript_32097/g.71333 Transcript_32097/m.71333 type:complete len:762 (-) Transcript_32097:131-2416(-)|eukprot:CAMPEP_0173185168 /NCGR_PEP_ID=MMETSP1141-20130122/9394_1 /TAXON_ID=483371 /ORGANISM="non described non described, Strain CCMP2298" /LENGTH=761 /DNA_ID=CAMNT_0014108645 /DNA_START=88 /DNA_END=2373 /DNA_ORIENTATION=+
MGFSFGVLHELDYTITLYCFLFVVAGVIGFEYMIGIMEYFLDGNRLYQTMIQMIYKELMVMGLITFVVMMYEATPPTHDVSSHEWVAAIDFSHIYLFFVTFFFVGHAFYLMFISSCTVTEYRKDHEEKVSELIEELENMKSTCWQRFLFSFKFLPFSALRSRVEFSLLHSTFNKTYLLPLDLEYPYYLSGVFDRFALKIINRSIFTWVVLLFVMGLNFCRIRYGWSSDRTVELVQEWFGQGTHAGHRGIEATRRLDVDRADFDAIYFFLGCGIILVLYSSVLTMIARHYKRRLVTRVYPEHETIDEYIDILRVKQRELSMPDATQSFRMSSAQLRKEIATEFDEYEEGEVEDEEGMRWLAQTAHFIYHWIFETWSDVQVWVRVTISNLCYPMAEEEARESTLLGIKSSKKKVAEDKKLYIPLKFRLKIVNMLPPDSLANHIARGDEMEQSIPLGASSPLNAANRAGYGSIAADADQRDLTHVVEGYRAAKAAHEEHKANNRCCAFGCMCCRCCRCCAVRVKPNVQDFNTIFFWSKPLWFFRAIELQITFTCMYMGLWATNFITVIKEHAALSSANEALYQILMLIPILMAIRSIAYIGETYSMINGVTELNLEVLNEVLCDSDDMLVLSDMLRAKIMEKIVNWSGSENPGESVAREFLHKLFIEVDQDGSGAIDKGEFRQMLRSMNLTFSDKRFRLLFRAVDSIGGDGTVEEEDLVEFMFPTTDANTTPAETPGTPALERPANGAYVLTVSSNAQFSSSMV